MFFGRRANVDAKWAWHREHPDEKEPPPPTRTERARDWVESLPDRLAASTAVVRRASLASLRRVRTAPRWPRAAYDELRAASRVTAAVALLALDAFGNGADEHAAGRSHRLVKRQPDETYTTEWHGEKLHAERHGRWWRYYRADGSFFRKIPVLTGAASIVANTGSNNWNTNGAWVGSVQPTAADDVTIPAAATVTIPSAVTALCRSISVSALGAIAFAATTSNLNIGDAVGGAATFASTSTVTLTAIGTINFLASTASTTYSLTTGGKVMPNLTVNTGSTTTIQFADAVTATGATITLTAGKLDTNGQTVSCSVFNLANSNTKSLTFGASSITCTSSSTPFTANTASSSNTTLSAASSTITCSGSGISFNAGSGTLSWGSIVLTGASSATLNANTTCVNFTRTGTATKTDTLSVNSGTAGSGLKVSGALVLNGNSATNRLLITSNTPGSIRSVVANGTLFVSNADFVDISGEGSASWNLSAITGNSGDAGGNSGITFTTSATQTHTASAGGNWSDATKWTSRVPLPQDDVVVDVNTTGTLTADMPRLGKNIDFTAFVGTLTLGNAVSLFGSMTLASGMTITAVNFAVTWAGRSSYTVTTVGKNFGGSSGYILGCPSGTYTLQDALTTAGNLTCNDGTLTTNDQTVTCLTVVATSGRTTVLNLGASTVNLTSTATATVWASNSGTTTLNAGTSNIVISTASTSARTFLAGGVTSAVFYDLTYTVANSPGRLVMGSTAANGTNSFHSVNIGSGRMLSIFSGAIISVPPSGWNVNGAANGYLYLPGLSGAYASAPDSAALSITSDITVLVRVALDDWTPTSIATLLGKDASTTTISYDLRLDTAGKPVLTLSNDGTAFVSATASVATGVADGTVKWVLASWRDSDNRCQFFTADGSIANPAASDFTQLGTDQTAASAGIFDSTSPLELGGRRAGTLEPTAGKFYRAMVYNGVFSTAAFGGTKQFDADLTRNVSASDWLDAAKTQFAESSSNAATVTINGTTAQVGDGRVTIISVTAGTQAVVKAQLVGAAGNVWTLNGAATRMTRESFLALPGTAGNYPSTPDSAALSIIGDLDVRVRLAADTWTPAATSAILAKWVTAGNLRSYELDVDTTGHLQLLTSTAGSLATTLTAISTQILGFAAGSTKWVRATMDVDNGASGNTVTFYTSNDGVTWTQLGNPVVTAGTTSIFDSTAVVEIGSSSAGTARLLAGKFYYADVRNNIADDGTGIQGVFDASLAGGGSSPTWTLNGTAVIESVDNGPFLYLSGASGNYVSTPDAAGISVTGDIDLRAKVAFDTLAPSASATFIGKYVTSGNQRSYWFYLLTSGALQITTTPDGTSTGAVSATSTVTLASVGVVVGTPVWVRATLDVDDGAGNRVVTFYISTNDGASWTQVGSVVTTVGTTSIFDSTATLDIGGLGSVASNFFTGKIYKAEVRNGIGGTVVANPDFTVVPPNIVSDYILLQDNAVGTGGAASWYAKHSAVVSNVSGWNVIRGALTFLDVSGAATPTGAVIKAATKALGGSETPAGTLSRLVSRQLGGTQTPTGRAVELVTKAFAGSETPSGLVTKIAARNLAGSTTPSGSLPGRLVSKSLAGALSTTGVSTKMVSTTYGGSEIPTGDLAHAVTRTFSGSGSLTPSGAVAKSVIRTLSGSETPSGAMVKAALRVLAGSTSPNGAVAKLVMRLLGGAETPTGPLSNVIGKSFSGSETSVGALPGRVASKSGEGVFDPSGQTSGVIATSMAGALTPAGAIAKTGSKSTSGSETPSGGIAKTALRSFAGSEVPSGAVSKAAARSFGGSETPTGVAARVAVKNLSGAIASSGSLVREVGRAFAGSLVLAGTVIKTIAKTIAGSETPSGRVAELIGRSFAGSQTPSGSLPARLVSKSGAGVLDASGRPALRASTAMAGALGPNGSLSKTVLVDLAGSEAPSGLVVAALSVHLSGTVAPSGVVARLVAKQLSGVETSTGTMRKLAAISVSGVESPAGSTANNSAHSFGGSLTPTGVVIRRATKVLVGSAAPSGSLVCGVSQMLAGTFSPLGRLTKITLRSAGGTFVPTGTTADAARRAFAGTLLASGALQITTGVQANLLAIFQTVGMRGLVQRLGLRRQEELVGTRWPTQRLGTKEAIEDLESSP